MTNQHGFNVSYDTGGQSILRQIELLDARLPQWDASPPIPFSLGVLSDPECWPASALRDSELILPLQNE